MLFGRGNPSLSGYNFTERVRKVLAMAREETARLDHEYVGTEHILLGLVREGEGVAATVLQNLNADLHEIRRIVEKTVKRGTAAARPPRPDLPYTSRGKKVLEFAMSEARELNHSYVGTEHLLLGLLREEKGIAAQVMASVGVTLDATRAETLRVLATERAPADWPRARDGSASARSAFHVRVDDTSDRSIYEQIVAQVQEAIATGALAPGERLATVRQLADELDIAPGTVARAYAELERLGVVVTEGARGTRVAPRQSPGMSETERPETLVGLLRPVVVAAFHLGASARELREALEKAMKDIFGDDKRDAA
jgi:DNA-binding transcriptional regulator YhcF (GntR family)